MHRPQRQKRERVNAVSREKNCLLWVALACAVSIALFYAYYRLTNEIAHERAHVEVGFILIGDESTPYSANFVRAVEALELQYGDRVGVNVRSNVAYEDAASVLRALCAQGCQIIFTNSYDYGETAKEVAARYPDVEFCQATCENANEEPVLSNYHTFMGEIYQGRYVSGLVAGLKLQELIDAGELGEDAAWIGYVGAFPYAECISAYTAFFLGARQTCPTVRMRVRYTNSWSSYMLEKEYAKALIEEGCVIISQDGDTIGPAVECENSDAKHPVFHVGYNQDMIDIAPTTALIGTRIDWAPYICGAVGAVLDTKRIENAVAGNVHGNDIGAGFSEGWVKMLELNPAIAPGGSEALIRETIAKITEGNCHVFKGDYFGIDPYDPNDTWDLNKEFPENKKASAPSFHYILQDVIVVE